MSVDSRDVVPKEVAYPQHTPHPSDGTQHIIPEEFAEFHAADPGDHGRKRADDRHELREHDCHTPIFFLKFVRADSMLLVEEKAVFPIENPWTGRAADEIAEGIADDRCEREDWGQLVYIQVPARGDQAGGNEQGIPRQKESEQKPGFRKDNYRQSKKPGPLHEVGKIRESVE
jgi:hypothetical protein